jgi:radical SAM protein with 4Fe4S-binding SPASM domain
MDTPVATFRRLLRRAPSAAETATLAQHPGHAAEMAQSFEHRAIVAPLERLLCERYAQWSFREASAAELEHDIGRTRHEAGGDQAVIAALRDGSIRTLLAHRPINLEMDVTNQCNLRCIMCLFSLPERRHLRPVPFDPAAFAELADDVFPVCHRVSLSYGTEPLLHPRLLELLAILGRYRVPRTYCNTNAQLLTDELIEGMIEHRFHSLFVSIDAATADTYEAIRRGGSWARLRDNLARLVRRRTAAGRGPYFSTGFVVQERNLDEMAAFVELSHEFGAVGVNFMHLTPYAGLGMSGATAQHHRERFHRNREAARRAGERLAITVLLPPAFADDPPAAAAVPPAPVAAQARLFDLATAPGWEQRAPCPFPWHFVAIDAYGNVLPCGWWTRGEPLGNVHARPLSAIWRDEPYRRLRDEHRTGRLRDLCAHCSPTGMGDPADPQAWRER